MPITPVLILIGLAVVANLVLMALIIVPPMLGRRSPVADEREPGVDPERRAAQAAVIGGIEGSVEAGEVPTRTYDRVVRVVAWVFILTTTAIVAATGLWPDTQPAIFVLRAFSGLFVLVVHDLLPEDTLGPAKFVVEGSVAITVALTGAAALGYVLAVLAGSPPDSIGPATAATVGVNLTALILLAYVAMVIARAQRRSRDAAIRLSTVDSLTGLFNRTFFFAAIDREIARSARSGRGFCLLMMDLDELKAINDRVGHFHGDRVLRAVGEVILSGVRQIDTAARYGGDEFVVLLPETDPTGAFVLAEKIRLGVSGVAIELPGGAPRPSLSIGVVSYPDDGRTADELIISADGAMYASKRAGKDRVTGTPLHEAGRPATPV